MAAPPYLPLQGVFRGVVKVDGAFDYFHHEGALAGGQVVYGAGAVEDPIGDTDAGGEG